MPLSSKELWLDPTYLHLFESICFLILTNSLPQDLKVDLSLVVSWYTCTSVVPQEGSNLYCGHNMKRAVLLCASILREKRQPLIPPLFYFLYLLFYPYLNDSKRNASISKIFYYTYTRPFGMIKSHLPQFTPSKNVCCTLL